MTGEKYLIVKTGYGAEGAIIFGGWLTHKQVAGNLNVVSAGFCELESVDLACYGKGFIYSVHGRSVSLGLESRQEDSEILNRLFNKEYF